MGDTPSVSTSAAILDIRAMWREDLPTRRGSRSAMSVYRAGKPDCSLNCSQPSRGTASFGSLTSRGQLIGGLTTRTSLPSQRRLPWPAAMQSASRTAPPLSARSWGSPSARPRKAIRLGFILDTQRVAAFVMENPELHRRRHLRHQLGIENDETLIRRGGIVAQQRVEDGRKFSASERVAVERELAVRYDLRTSLVIRDVHFRCRIGE